jgi:hypothetical protein
MKAKALVVGVSCAAALAAVILLRSDGPAPVRPKSAPKAVSPMASFRVFEESRTDGLGFRGVGYSADLRAEGLTFEGGGVKASVRATRVEQGGRGLDLAPAAPSRDRFGAAVLDRGPVVEEFIFENRRVEQVVHVREPLGEGGLVVRCAIETDLGGPVTAHRRAPAAFRAPELREGGLAFADATGRDRLYYHTAVAVDASGRRCQIDPRWENGQAVLEVPASWMAAAAYPVAVDPFLQLDSSASLGGVSETFSVSDGPAIAIEGGGNPYVTWSDNSAGNFEVFMRYWNGFEWREYAGSATSGISGNTGESVNPAIALSPSGKPYIVWQDNSNGNIEVYAKRWTGVAWEAMGSSASGGGVSDNGGISQNAQIGITSVFVPFPTPKVVESAFVVWEDTSFASDILGRFFYPGDPGDNGAPAAVPSGWYDLGGSSTGFGISQTATGVSQVPSLAMDPITGQPIVAWQDSANGNYEIYVLRHSDSPPYSVTVGGTVTPGGTWDQLGTSGSGGGVSATAGLSRNPSIGVDAAGAIFVAWEEDVSAINSEIFLKRSDGVGAFAEVDGSVSVDGTNPLLAGISRTATRSTLPSVGVSVNGDAVVAWQDDFNGNPEIHVRRNFAASTTWEQVGLGLSAAAIPGEAAGSSGGISKTSTLSLAPSVKADFTGDPVVAWMDGADGNFEVFLLRFFANAPLNIQQTNTLAVAIPVGATTNQTTVNLIATVFTETFVPAATVRLEFEVRLTNSAFSGVDEIYTTTLQPGDTVVTKPITGLVNGSYKWRVRTVDNRGRASSWQSFGGNDDESDVDFVVNTGAVPPSSGGGGPVVIGGSSNEEKDKCGLTGLEAVLALGALAFVRRRRLTRRG